MVLGNIERLEIVVGRLDFGAFDHAEADRKENALKFFVGLANQVARADGALDAGKRKINLIARRGGLFRGGFDRRAASAASVASTCALSLFSSCPTTRFSSGGAGFSQLSVICESTPDFRPSQRIAHSFPGS